MDRGGGASTSGAASRDDYDDDEYEEGGGGRRYGMGGFMFGNVDVEGDLDADYLDEDAKEHLAAIVDKLGSSFTDIDLIKSSPTRTDTSEQDEPLLKFEDYDEKAEDGIDYEDFDEQYDGPETEATTEDHLLPKKEYFSSDPILSSLNHKASVFDEDNYDEDEDTINTIKEDEVTENIFAVTSFPSEDNQFESVEAKRTTPDDSFASVGVASAKATAFELKDSQPDIVQDLIDPEIDTSLPVLCIEDGLVILRFSDIFGVHEPLKKVERKAHHRYSKIKGFQGKETC